MKINMNKRTEFHLDDPYFFNAGFSFIQRKFQCLPPMIGANKPDQKVGKDTARREKDDENNIGKNKQDTTNRQSIAERLTKGEKKK